MYRFGSALREAFECVDGMRVGDERVFNIDELTTSNSLCKFRARISDVSRDNGWIFVTRKTGKHGEVMVRRIK